MKSHSELYCVIVTLLFIFIKLNKADDFYDIESDDVILRNRRFLEPDRVPYISTGALTYVGGNFLLNGSSLRILSGAVHYFRTVPEYWRDRLLKLKACGLNTVETYVPWNLHEEYPGTFNFEGILDVRGFIQLAKEVGLHVIFRPGPYICSEWEFGGLPGWLLQDPAMKVRSNYAGYTQAVERYFDQLIPLVADLQYSKGGPIIAIQVENEFGSYSSDSTHLKFIKDLFEHHGLVELFVTSDNNGGINQDIFYDEALPTANFKQFSSGRGIFETIHDWSGEFPLMVMEFWTGWFDFWGSSHSQQSADEYGRLLEDILKAGASVNFYMFHGGTTFGFLNGANQDNHDAQLKTDVSSYDYDAILSEKGDTTPKYLKTRELLQQYIYTPLGQTLPLIPDNVKSTSYGTISSSDIKYLSFEDYLQTIAPITASYPVTMEMLNVTGGYGQNFGYTLYRTDLPSGDHQLEFSNRPRDRAQIFVDGSQTALIDWQSETSVAVKSGSQETSRLDILVENLGRVNYGSESTGVLNSQRKGIHGDVTLSGNALSNFKIYPLEFKANSTDCCGDQWQDVSAANAPGLFKGNLQIDNEPEDTFVFMKGWGKGIVFVNGVNLGRYWHIGPQQTLYIPAPLLKSGANQISWFEQEQVGESVVFTENTILDVNDPSTIDLQ